MSELVSIHRIKSPDVLASQGPARKRLIPTKEHPVIVSASELRDWLRCRVKHHWRHQVRLEPNELSENLAIGRAVHEILELWYTLPWQKRNAKRMMKIAAAYLVKTTPATLPVDQRELVGAMCIGYAAWAKPQDEEIGLRDCTPEQWFDLPLTDDGDVRVRGKIDCVYQSVTLKRVAGNHEYKTKGQIKTDMIDLNLQLSVYLWALRTLIPKMKSYRTHYNVLRKQLPGPRVTADLFARETVERSDAEIEQWARDTRLIALEMVGAAVYPNPQDSCSWDCDHKQLCLLRGHPDDLRHVVQTQFRIKEKRT